MPGIPASTLFKVSSGPHAFWKGDSAMVEVPQLTSLTDLGETGIPSLSGVALLAALL